jgi:signal transduction histidine kinase
LTLKKDAPQTVIMSMRPALARDGSARTLILVFTVVVGSFLVTTVAVQRTSTEIDSLSESIVSNSSVSIEHLASLRALTLEVELTLSRYIQEERARRSSIAPALDRALRNLKKDVRAYLALPYSSGEQQHWGDIREGWVRLDESSRRARDLCDAANSRDAWQVFAHSVEPAASRLIDAAMRAIEFNAQNGRSLASQIREARRRAVWLANGLTAFCIALGVAGALLINRQARSRRAVAQAHSTFLEERAAELEQFAGRVAHDIQNPLATAKMAAELVMQSTSDANLLEFANRGVRSLSRAASITSALLDFARSGARPDPGARTSPREVIADLEAGVAPEAERARIDFRIEPVPPVLVACSVGVYLSLVSNLVRNAIKYMGEVSPRRIVIRVGDEGAFVRTEVADTGPGIPGESLQSLFEPYFRGRGSGRDGLGLGLATVKRLAEGHHGRVGVTSAPGKGSTFWFLLPRAGSAWDATDSHDSDERGQSVVVHH